jgi:hypothetical protein
MAWRVSCHGLLAGDEYEDGEWKWRSAGYYTQMCKFSSFLKLGMLALLFYHAGGCPCNYCKDDYYYHYYNNNNDDNFLTMQGRHALECSHGCNCGVAGCGKSPCYEAFLATLPIVDGVLEVLALVDWSTIVATGNGNFPTASDELAKMAHIMHGFNSVEVKGSCGHIGS